MIDVSIIDTTDPFWEQQIFAVHVSELALCANKGGADMKKQDLLPVLGVIGIGYLCFKIYDSKLKGENNMETKRNEKDDIHNMNDELTVVDKKTLPSIESLIEPLSPYLREFENTCCRMSNEFYNHNKDVEALLCDVSRCTVSGIRKSVNCSYNAKDTYRAVISENSFALGRYADYQFRNGQILTGGFYNFLSNVMRNCCSNNTIQEI